ncbi:hypothetical protein GOP47_0020345, partial [Adiantum capillus-veneris]
RWHERQRERERERARGGAMKKLYDPQAQNDWLAFVSCPDLVEEIPELRNPNLFKALQGSTSPRRRSARLDGLMAHGMPDFSDPQARENYIKVYEATSLASPSSSSASPHDEMASSPKRGKASTPSKRSSPSQKKQTTASRRRVPSPAGQVSPKRPKT